MRAWGRIGSSRSAGSALGVHARWHGIIAPGGIADFFSVSVGLSLRLERRANRGRTAGRGRSARIWLVPMVWPVATSRVRSRCGLRHASHRAEVVEDGLDPFPLGVLIGMERAEGAAPLDLTGCRVDPVPVREPVGEGELHHVVRDTADRVPALEGQRVAVLRHIGERPEMAGLLQPVPERLRAVHVRRDRLLRVLGKLPRLASIPPLGVDAGVRRHTRRYASARRPPRARRGSGRGATCRVPRWRCLSLRGASPGARGRRRRGRGRRATGRAWARAWTAPR